MVKTTSRLDWQVKSIAINRIEWEGVEEIGVLSLDFIPFLYRKSETRARGTLADYKQQRVVVSRATTRAQQHRITRVRAIFVREPEDEQRAPHKKP